MLRPREIVRKIVFITKRGKPRLILKLVRINLKFVLFRKVPPFRNIEIQTSFACNLRCVHCSAEAFAREENILSMEDYREIARQCHRYDAPMVSFTGGEPLYDQRLEGIIGCFDTGSMLVSITTNGILLTPERADRLKEAGVDSLVISLDGPDPESNDAIRGKGTFKRIMQAIDVAESKGFFVMIIHTITHKSIEDGVFDGLIELARSKNVPMHVSLASPVGNWAEDHAKRKYMMGEDDVAYLRQAQAKYPFLRRDLDGNYQQVGCPAGKERFVISPSGDVLPCTKIQAKFGNVREEPMFDIRNRMVAMDVFKDYPEICLVAEDDSFLDSYLPGVFGRTDLPLPHKEYFAPVDQPKESTSSKGA